MFQIYKKIHMNYQKIYRNYFFILKNVIINKLIVIIFIAFYKKITDKNIKKIKKNNFFE